MNLSQARRQASSKLSELIPKTRKIVSNKLNTYLEVYNNGYFDDPYFWTIADETIGK